MNRRYYAIACSLLLVPIIAYFVLAHRQQPITNYPSHGTDIIAFGDSLVAGSGATNGHDFVSGLSQKIGVPIINLGVSGNTTADALARISELDTHDPKVVLLLLGGNDVLRKVPPAETFANLSRVIEAIQKRGAIVVLLGVRGGLLSDTYADQYKALAEKYHTAYVPDVLQGLFGHAEYMSDEVHPNDAGYVIIANRIVPVLSPLLN